MKKLKVNLLFIITTLFLHFTVSILNAEILYNITDIGTLPGSYGSSVFSINNLGQVVGCYYKGPDLSLPQPFMWDHEREMVDLGLLGGDENQGRANSINNNSQIVGSAGFNVFISLGVIFDSTGNNNNLGLGIVGQTSAFSINDLGQIVGVSNGDATLFDSSGQGSDIKLGTLPGGEDAASFAFSINNIGQIVGTSVTSVPRFMGCATLFDSTGNGNNMNLGTLGGDISSAYSINDHGQIVGESAISGRFDTRAALFDNTGTGNNINLGSLGGDGVHDWSSASSINNNGDIVGSAMNILGEKSAVLFDNSGIGNNVDLNDIIDPTCDWELKYAMCINDNGWIVGDGMNPDGERRGFLLTPVPEPNSLFIFSIGFYALTKRKIYAS